MEEELNLLKKGLALISAVLCQKEPWFLNFPAILLAKFSLIFLANFSFSLWYGERSTSLPFNFSTALLSI